MNGCRRNYCPDCDSELIHRDHRGFYESASAFGQIMHRAGPLNLTLGDIDAYVMKRLSGRVLLRLVEHKQPSQRLNQNQQAVLRMLEELFQHHMSQPPEDPMMRLDPRSGVYIMRGHIEGTQDGRRHTQFQGAQHVHRIDTAQREKLSGHEAVCEWLEGFPGGPRRNGTA